MDKKYTNEDIEKMLINETSNVTPDLLNQIKLKAQSIKKEEIQKEEAVEEKSKFSFRRLFSPLKLTLSFILVIALVISITGINVYGKTVETITIDVNPSVELCLNRFDRVIKVNYNNEDAKAIFEKVDLKNKKIDSAIESCYNTLLENGYLDNTDSNMIVISGYDETDEAEDKVANTLVDAYKIIKELNKENNVSCEVKHNYVTKEVKEFAKENNITVGEIKVIDLITDLDPDANFDELVKKSMNELKEIYSELKKDKPESNPGEGHEVDPNTEVEDVTVDDVKQEGKKSETKVKDNKNENNSGNNNKNKDEKENNGTDKKTDESNKDTNEKDPNEKDSSGEDPDVGEAPDNNVVGGR